MTIETAATNPKEQYLTFDLAGEEYAIAVFGITEIIDCGSLTAVQGAPVHLRGVVHVRGAAVPVVDLALAQGMPATPLSRSMCIVIVEVDKGGERGPVGVLVDILTCRLKSSEPAAPAEVELQWPSLRLWGKPTRGLC